MKVDKISIQNKRKSNQDSYISVMVDNTVILGVFDGIGGLSGGEEASSKLRDSILQSQQDGYSLRGILEAIYSSNKDIHNPEQLSGSTLCMGILDRNSNILTTISSGDSRLYFSNAFNPTIDTFRLLTVDDSVANLQPDRVLGNNREFSTLVYAIGVKPVVHIRVNSYQIDSTDVSLLVSSDGFWHTFDTLQKSGSTDLVNIHTLTEQAVSLGETDNITSVFATEMLL
jgi:PPM family protein phosphatase